MRPVHRAAAALVAFAAAVASVALADPPAQEHREKVLAIVPAGRSVMNAEFRADGGAVLHVDAGNDGWFVAVGDEAPERLEASPRAVWWTGSGSPAWLAAAGGKDPKAAALAKGGLTLRIGGETRTVAASIGDPVRLGDTSFASVAWTPEGTVMALTVDGKELARHGRILSLVAESGQLAFQAEDEGRLALVFLDAATGRVEVEVPRGSRPAFGRGGGRACAVAAGDANQAQERAWINGQEGAPYDGVGEFSFSPDGKTVTYGARRGDRQTLVVSGKEGAWRPFEDPNRHPAQPGQGPRCPLPVPPLPRAVFSPDGTIMAVVVHDPGARVIVGDQEGPAGTYVRTVEFSRTGGVLAAVLGTGNGDVAYVAGKERARADLVHRLVLSPDGKRFAAAVGLNGPHVLVDGVEGPKYARVYGETLRFSDDGTRVEYGAMTYRAKAEDPVRLVWVTVAVK